MEADHLRPIGIVEMTADRIANGHAQSIEIVSLGENGVAEGARDEAGSRWRSSVLARSSHSTLQVNSALQVVKRPAPIGIAQSLERELLVFEILQVSNDRLTRK